MKLSPSVVLVSVAVLVGGYTIYDYRQAAKHDGVGEFEVRPFVSDPRETTQVQMVRSGGEKIRLSREAGADKWKMLEPVVDEVEGSAVDAILFSLTSQKAKELIPEGGGNPKWSEFGLEPPAMEFEVVSGKKIEKLAISSKNSFDGSFYLRFQDKMYLGDRGLAHLLAKSANSLRTKKLWRHDSDAAENSIHNIEVHFDSSKPSTYSLVKDNGLWSLRPERKFPVDPELIEKWLESLLRLSAQDIEVENPTAEDLKRALMLKPSFQVSFDWSEGQEKAQNKPQKWQLTVGQDIAENKGQEAFIRQSERSTLYKIAVDRLKDLRVGPDYFRDRKRAFKFSLEQTTSVEFYVKGKKYVAIKSGSEWKLDGQKPEGSEKAEKLDTTKLESLFQKLNGLRVASFEKGKDLPEGREDQKLVLRSASGEVLLNLRWGGYLKGKDGKPDRSKRFVRTQAEIENLLVENQSVETLVDPGLVVVK